MFGAYWGECPYHINFKFKHISAVNKNLGWGEVVNFALSPPKEIWPSYLCRFQNTNTVK